MADRQETRQEQETRWAAQRFARDTQDQTYRAQRARARGRIWLMVAGVFGIIMAVIAAIMLL